MKRISVMAAIMSVGLLSIMIFSAGGASASVLCKEKAATCPKASVYPAGTEIGFGGKDVKLVDAWGIPAFKCKNSGILLTITNAGGESPSNNAETEITQWPFEECEDFTKAARYPQQVGNPFSVVFWNSGTYTGEFQISGEKFEVVVQGVGTCQYQLVEQPTLMGPDESSSKSRLVFSKELAVSTGPCSGYNLYFSGTYNRLYSYDPIYVTSG